MNLVIVYPTTGKGEPYNFKKVVENYGFPMFSKEVSCTIRTYNRALSERTKATAYDYMERNNKKYLKYINCKISDKCCEKLKKSPTRRKAKKLGLECSIIGILAVESRRCETDWLEHGCIYETSKDVQCRPLSFWMEKDIYEYIEKYNVKISKLYEMGYSRNGCIFCGFGVHLQGEENRYTMLKKTHPRSYKYLIDNFKDILDECDIKY